MGQIIAIASPKGGVGKTTTAVNLSYAFALKNKRTLLIDLDPAGSCSSSIGFDKEKTKGDIFSVFNYNKALSQVIHSTSQSNLYFIPLNNLCYKDEVRLVRLAGNHCLLRNILQPEVFHFDYIIMDCPPYLIGLTHDALIAANSVIIPVMVGKFSIDAVDKILEHMSAIRRNFNQNLAVEGILLTSYEYNTRISFSAKKELYLKYPNYMFRTTIPRSIAVTEASYKLKPSILYNSEAQSSLAYFQLAKEIMEKNNDYMKEVSDPINLESV
jgi:chromosome partitioning protein